VERDDEVNTLNWSKQTNRAKSNVEARCHTARETATVHSKETASERVEILVIRVITEVGRSVAQRQLTASVRGSAIVDRDFFWPVARQG